MKIVSAIVSAKVSAKNRQMERQNQVVVNTILRGKQSVPHAMSLELRSWVLTAVQQDIDIQHQKPIAPHALKEISLRMRAE